MIDRLVNSCVGTEVNMETYAIHIFWIWLPTDIIESETQPGHTAGYHHEQGEIQNEFTT